MKSTWIVMIGIGMALLVIVGVTSIMVMHQGHVSLAASLPREKTLVYHQSTRSERPYVLNMIERNLSVHLPSIAKNERNEVAVLRNTTGAVIITESLPKEKGVDLFTNDRFIREQLREKNVTIFRPSVLSTENNVGSILQALVLESEWCALTGNTSVGRIACSEGVKGLQEQEGTLNLFSSSEAVFHAQIIEPHAVLEELKNHLRHQNSELADGIIGILTYWATEAEVGKLFSHLPAATQEIEIVVRVSSGATLDTMLALRGRPNDIAALERTLESQNDMSIRETVLDQNHRQRDIITLPARTEHVDGWNASLRTQGLSFARKGDVMLIATSNRLLSQAILQKPRRREASTAGSISMDERRLRTWMSEKLPFLSKDLEQWIQTLGHHTIILESLNPLRISWGSA